MSYSNGTAPRQIALNGNGGAWTEIDATVVSRYAEAIEDLVASGAASQGLEWQFPIIVDGVLTGWGPTFSSQAGDDPVQFGDKKYLYTSKGPILGQPGQQTIGQPGPANATPICRMRSATATATVIDFTEYM